MSIAWTGRRAAVLMLYGAIAAGVAALWALGSSLSAPAPRALGPPPAELGIVETVEFPSDSGSAIHAWLAPGHPGCGVVVLAHAVRSSRLDMVGRAALLRRAGYTALLFDAQAHGESPGERITFGYREALDAHAAVAHVRAHLPHERIGYLGVSQGGAAALLGGAPLAVDALVLEAVYPTLREAVVARIGIRLGPLAPYLAPLLLLQVPARIGVDADRIAPIEGIAHVRAPLLLIAGEDDRHTPLAQSQRLFDAAPDPKTLWVVPGVRHVDFQLAAPDAYGRRVLAFFGDALREDGACDASAP